MEEYLENLDINVLRNHDYTSGVKTSIRLGLKSVPSSCDGALLIPADMPNLSADYLNRMIKKFAKGKERKLNRLLAETCFFGEKNGEIRGFVGWAGQ